MDETPRRQLQWSTSPSAKAKIAVQRSVTALLDELAPERALRGLEKFTGPVEQQRKPAGCVLQAADCALSVSWFTDRSEASPHGELHVLVWRGKVARRSISPNAKAATLASELVLRPIEPPTDECLWQSADGSRYDTAALATKCLALLEAEIGVSERA